MSRYRRKPRRSKRQSAQRPEKRPKGLLEGPIMGGSPSSLRSPKVVSREDPDTHGGELSLNRRIAPNSSEAEPFHNRFSELQGRHDNLVRDNEALKEKLEKSHFEVNSTKKELEQWKAEANSTKRELEQSKTDAKSTKDVLDQAKVEVKSTKKKLEQSKAEVNSTKKELKQSQAQVKSTKKDLEHSKAEVRSTRKDLEQSQGIIQLLDEEIEDLEGQNKEKVEKMAKMKAHILNLRNEIKRKNDEAAILRSERRKAQQQLEVCTSDLQAAQSESFQQSETRWSVIEDSYVRENIAEIYKGVRAWAKAYSVESLDHLLDNLPHHYGMLKDLSCVSDFTTLDSLASMKYPFLLLAALLSEHLRQYIFDKPFFIFETPRGLFGIPSVESPLTAVFCQMLSANPFEAHKWRTAAFRNAFPQLQHSNPPNPSEMLSPQGISRADVEKTYKVIMDSLVFGTARPLMRFLNNDEQNARDQKLHRLIVQAGNLFIQLQTQQVPYDWKAPESYLRMPFAASSTIMKADRLNKITDDQDTKHDGKLVKLVLSPPILAYGDPDGRNYDHVRAITKATVYLDDGADAKPALGGTL